MKYLIHVDGEEFAAVMLETVAITEQLEGRNSTASFQVPIELALEGLPADMADVVIYNDATMDVEFAGYLTSKSQVNLKHNLQVWSIGCVSAGDYRIKNTFMNQSFTEPTSDKAIIQGVFASLLPEIDTTQVDELATGITLEAKDISLEELLNRLSDQSGAMWLVNQQLELIYRPPGALAAPFGFSDNPSDS